MPDLLCDVQGSGAADPAAAAGAMKIGELPPFVLHRLDTPVVCGLNGPAAGYGMDLALGCDFVDRVGPGHAGATHEARRRTPIT